MTGEEAAADRPGASAGELFGARLPLVERYLGWLAGPGIERGLLGPRERDRLWSRHVLNSALVADLMPPGTSVADVGSGAGLPGMVVALRRPDLHLTLIEPLLRRSTFLTEVVRDLGLGDQVEVVRARAEDLAGSWRFDVVTARAVAPLERLCRWCLPLLAPGGQLLALKGASAPEELAAARPSLDRYRLREVELVEVGTGVDSTWVVRIVPEVGEGGRPGGSARGAGRSRGMGGSRGTGQSSSRNSGSGR